MDNNQQQMPQPGQQPGPIPQHGPQPGPPPGAQPNYQQYAMPAPRVPSKPFYRPSADRTIGGVCAAIADYFGWDRTLVRIATVLIAFAAGSGLVAYLIAWCLIPSEETHWRRVAAQAAAAGDSQAAAAFYQAADHARQVADEE